MPESPSVAEMFTHIHYVRLVFLSENAPQFATRVPSREWRSERNTEAIAEALEHSSQSVHDAVASLIRSGRPMNLHYDHPLLFLQHMIWHEGYHHGQIKLALKMSGQPLQDQEIGLSTWHLWFDKTT